MRSAIDVALWVLVLARGAALRVPSWEIWSGGIRAALIVLLAVRVVFLLTAVHRRALPWRRVVFPAFVLVNVLCIAVNVASATLMTVAMMLLELGILLIIICIAGAQDAGRGFEERTADRLQLYFPPLFARYVTAEMAIIRAVLHAVTGRGRPCVPGAGEFGYVENSRFVILPLLALFCTPVDMLAVDLTLRVMKVTGMLWPLLLGGLNIYMVIWAYGTLSTMRARPHAVTDTHLRVRKGIYKQADIPLDSIESARPLPSVKTNKEKGAADFSLRGVPRVEIRLREPARITTCFVPDSLPVSRVILAADDPDGLCRAIGLRCGALPPRSGPDTAPGSW